MNKIQEKENLIKKMEISTKEIRSENELMQYLISIKSKMKEKTLNWRDAFQIENHLYIQFEKPEIQDKNAFKRVFDDDMDKSNSQSKDDIEQKKS